MLSVKRSGIALVTALLISLLIAVLIAGLFASTRHQTQLTFGQNDRIRAHYAAEAGLVAAMDALRDRTWTAGFSDQPLSGGEATFSLTFTGDPTGTVGPDESVNNLLGVAAVNGPRGAGTVPPGFCHLVITGKSRSRSEILEVVLRNGAFPLVGTTVMADDTIEFSGDVVVSGVDNLREGNAVDAPVHTNKDGSGTLIDWNGSGTAIFEGTVSAVGPTSGLNLAGATLNGSPPTEGTAGAREFPYVDVAAEVDAKTGATEVSAPPVGDLTVGSSAPGDFRAGPTVVNGNLILDGGTLYVNGDLTVLGGIRGEGAVYVKGETSFFGDSTITTNHEKKVAVYSSGDITLTGFNGTQYMNALTDPSNPGYDPVLDQLWTNTQAAVADVKTFIDPSSSQYNLSEADRVRASLGERIFGSEALPGPVVPDYLPSGTHSDGGTLNWSPYGHDLFRHMADHLSTKPSSPTRDFLIAKFLDYEHFFHNKDVDVDRNNILTDFQTIETFRDGGHPGGPLDQMMDRVMDNASTQNVQNLREMAVYLDRVEPTRLGQSYFQGLVYTNANLLVENEIQIIGGVMAKSGVGQGRMEFDQGTQVTFVEEYFDPKNPLLSGGPPRVVTRISR